MAGYGEYAVQYTRDGEQVLDVHMTFTEHADATMVAGWRVAEGHADATVVRIISDDLLEAWATDVSAGQRNAVASLRPLTPVQRALAVSDGMTRQNMCPGYNFSGAVAASAMDVVAGRTPFLDRAEEERQKDQATRRARGWLT